MGAVLVEDQVARSAAGGGRNVEQTLDPQGAVEAPVAERADCAVEQTQDVDAVGAEVNGQQQVPERDQLVDV